MCQGSGREDDTGLGGLVAYTLDTNLLLLLVEYSCILMRCMHAWTFRSVVFELFYGDRETVRFSGGKIIIRKKKGRRKKGEGRVCGMCTMYTCIWHMYACVGCPVD